MGSASLTGARESLNLGYLQRGKVHFSNTGGVSVELMVPLSPQLCSGAALPVLLQPRAVCPLTPCACGTATSVRSCLFVCLFAPFPAGSFERAGRSVCALLPQQQLMIRDVAQPLGEYGNRVVLGKLGVCLCESTDLITWVINCSAVVSDSSLSCFRGCVRTAGMAGHWAQGAFPGVTKPRQTMHICTTLL